MPLWWRSSQGWGWRPHLPVLPSAMESQDNVPSPLPGELGRALTPAPRGLGLKLKNYPLTKSNQPHATLPHSAARGRLQSPMKTQHKAEKRSSFIAHMMSRASWVSRSAC